MLEHRQPIHFGGMSDPFPPVESHSGTTLAILRCLAEHKYPTVIRTKGTQFATDQYLEVLKEGTFVIQVSMSTLDERLAHHAERKTPRPEARLNAAAIALREGIPVNCRIQPVLPTREADVFELIDACADVGMTHVAVEHLKLPIETSWQGSAELAEALGINLRKRFEDARRVGREWVLPVRERLPRMVVFRGPPTEEG
jgi:DNA repair photolyase